MRKSAGFAPISIHAPREGSDLAPPPADQLPSISIHAPREGSDKGMIEMTMSKDISIHAPREGSDPSGFISRSFT